MKKRNKKHTEHKKQKKYKTEKKLSIKKIKFYFALVIIFLWIFVGFKLYFLLNDNESANESVSIQTEEIIPEDLEEEEILEEEVDSPATIFFADYLYFLYSEYYDIIDVRAVDFIPEDEDLTENEKFYFVTIEKQLKYNSVFQLPFVSGMQKAVEDLPNSKKAKIIYNKKTNELKEYIGRKQVEHNIFKVTFKEFNNFETAKIQIATYHEKTSAELLKPPSFEIMKNYGYEFIKKQIKNKAKKIDYNNDKAICYADRYSSNPFKTGINQKCWNKKYKPYENDCANFVSQCLYAGGIKATKRWFPGSFYWIRTGSPKYRDTSGVSDYMQNIKRFYKTNYSAISAGGFICMIKESHVVFVASNDSITILFNGHTNDRKRVSFPHLDKNEVMYLNPNN